MHSVCIDVGKLWIYVSLVVNVGAECFAFVVELLRYLLQLVVKCVGI